MRPNPGHLATPAHRPGLHVGQAGEAASAPERVPHVGDHSFDPGLVLRLLGPRRVDQAAVVLGHLRIGPVEQRVVEVGTDHPGLQVVGNQPQRHPAEELPRRNVRGHPGGGIHAQHRPHEHVPGAGQHDHERLHPPQPATHRIHPAAQVAVVDLCLPDRRARPQHRHRARSAVLRKRLAHIPTQAGLAGGHPVLVAQPLVHRGQGVRLHHLRDQLPAALQLRPGPAARLRVHQLREPARHPRGPPGPVADQTVARTDPLRLGRALEYLWKAVWCFDDEGDPAAEAWVRRHATALLAGRATRVAGAIRRQATTTGLDPRRRANADIAATYLTNKAAFLDYPTALEHGWPIATGVIEGACRHLVKDRMDITGARWGLPGAEAVLKLRALHSNGDWDEYWRYHLSQEKQRIHQSLYAADVIPQAA